MRHPHYEPIRKPGPTVLASALATQFGEEFTNRIHPLGLGVQWIGTVGGFHCSIVYSTAGTYELLYTDHAGDDIVINSRGPAGIIKHLDMLRGEHLDMLEDTAGDNS